MLADRAPRSRYSTRSSRPVMTTPKNTRAMAKPFPNPKLQVDHGHKSQTDQITTKFRSDDAILHELAWRSQWRRSRLLHGQQCHTFQIFTCCIDMWRAHPEGIFPHPLSTSTISNAQTDLLNAELSQRQSTKFCRISNYEVEVNVQTRHCFVHDILPTARITRRTIKESFVRCTYQYSVDKRNPNSPHEPHDRRSASIWPVMQKRSSLWLHPPPMKTA
jgi:hypothetical protein